MKKLSFFLTGALFAAIVSTHAQNKLTDVSEKLSNSDEHLAKTAVDLRIRAKLYETYSNVVEETWQKIKNGYFVQFTSNGVKHEAFLNSKGKMTSQIRLLDENDLPKNVLRSVKNMDGCFTIGLCQEITTELGQAYLITISGDNYWKILRFVGDEMEVYQEFKKG